MSEDRAPNDESSENPADWYSQRRNRNNRLSSVQVMFAAVLAIGLLLALTFSSRITAGQPLEDFHAQIVAEIEKLEREQAELLAARDYAMSDAYVEAWARDEGKMAREGEVLIIPVQSSIAASEEVIALSPIAMETTPSEPESWTLWWSLFFDSPPPQF